jgi:O-antigen ligase
MWFSPTRLRFDLALGMLAVLIGGVLATGSRGPLLGLVAGVLILTLLKSKGRLVKTYVLVIAGSVLGYVMVATDFFSTSRLVESFEEGEIYDTSGRDQLLSTSLAIIREHPEGVGVGNISNYDYWYSLHAYPHNIFVEVLAEHGSIVGTLFVLAILVTLVRLLVQARTNDYALLLTALLAAEIVNVSFSGDLNARSFFFFATLSIWVLFWATHSRPFGGRTADLDGQAIAFAGDGDALRAPLGDTAVDGFPAIVSAIPVASTS